MEKSKNNHNNNQKKNFEDKLFNSSLKSGNKQEDQYYQGQIEKGHKSYKKNKFDIEAYNDGYYGNSNKNYNHNAYRGDYHADNNYIYVEQNYYGQGHKKNVYHQDESYYNYPVGEYSGNSNHGYNDYDNYEMTQNYPSTKKINSKPKKNKHKGNKLTDLSKINNQKENILLYLKSLSVEAPELTMNLINGLIESTIDCMICNDTVDGYKEIWECDKCYTIYHNTCIYDWIFKLNSVSEEKAKKILEYKWTCPHCSKDFVASADNLPSYNCYCKKFYEAQKTKNKQFNANLIPHGCGLTCNTEICRHVTCTLPCHPGPHLTCSQVEKIKCFCLKQDKEISCTNLNKKFSCNETCNKALPCKRHFCKQKCHEAECETFLKNKKCEECIIESKKKFFVFLKNLQDKINQECKENITSLADGLSEYIFHGTLFCGIHAVEPSTDSNLEFLLKLLKISGNKLAENIKKFIPICKQVVDNSCDCRNKVGKTECFRLYYEEDILMFLNLFEKREKAAEKCAKACRSFKNCRNHRCTRVCCELSGKVIRNFSIDDPEGHHLCLIACDKILNCEVHKCEGFCHKGICKACPNIIREGQLTCDCGKTKIDAPYQCGSEVNCKYACDKVSPCEHNCKVLCHKGECLPCEEITFKMCRCGKNVINGVRCGDKDTPLCKSPCGEMLTCGVHFCQLNCHDHTEEFDQNYFCMMPCGRDFLKCNHKCLRRCHGDDECNEVECEIQVKISCKCKTYSRNIKCGEFKKLYDNDNNYVIPCIDECTKKERLRKIEQAFEDLLKFSEEKNKIYSHRKTEEGDKFLSTKFDNNILEFAKKNAKLIVEIESYVEKSLKNQLQKIELPRTEKKLFTPISEFLKTYYNIKVDKIKKGENWTTLVLSDCSEAVIPKYRLSLYALIFKHNKFVKFPKMKIYHPFEMSILIQNYRFNVLNEDIENFLVNFCSASKNDFYIDELEKGKCYAHFFNLEMGKKVFYQLKHKANQFQDASEIYYKLKDDLKLSDLYLYIRNQDYFNLLYYKDEEEILQAEDSNIGVKDKDASEPDADGFVLISKGKKPK